MVNQADEYAEDDEDGAGAWDAPLTVESALARIEQANRREALPAGELDYRWGGDGSDLHDPVAVHVQAALVPTDAPYPPPLDELLRLGDARTGLDWNVRLAALDLTQAHVPDLVRMTRDRALNTAMSDTDEVWGPIHALHALELLDVTEFVADLIPLFDVDTDWFGPGLQDVLQTTGATGLELLAGYLHDRERWIYGRANAAGAIAKIAGQQEDLRPRAVQILSDELSHAAENHPTVNAFLVSELLHLHAVEALPVIRRAFEHDLVDEMAAGDWRSVLVGLGQIPDPRDSLITRSRTRLDATRARWLPPFMADRAPAQPKAPKKSSRATPKTKRKESRKKKRK